MQNYTDALTEAYTGILSESSLTRVYQQSLKHDTGTISAFRYATECGEGKPYSKSDNKKRNKVLKAQLQQHGYGITKVDGVYIENFGKKDKEREVAEDVFLVVDLKDDGNLEKTLRKLGEVWDQDSILFIPKGGKSGQLIGTNHCPDGYPDYGKKVNFKNALFGQSGEFLTKVNGRPFVLKEENAVDVHEPRGFYGKYGVKILSESDWTTLDDD